MVQQDGTLLEDIVKERVKRKLYKKLLIPLIPVILFVLSILLVLILVLFSVSGGKVNNWSGDISDAGSSEIPAEYLQIYHDAGEAYGVPWNLLAAIHKVETDFGQVLAVSSAGAIGHMQFMPKTWIGWSYPGVPSSLELTSVALINQYGGYGVDGDGDGKADPNNACDAIYAAANYLAANGAADGDYSAAVYAYNHADWYVEKVLSIAESYVATTKVSGAGFIWPVPSNYTTISSPFGYRSNPVTGAYHLHSGIDIPVPTGTDIYASKSGTVTAAAYHSSMGNYVMIDHGDGTSTIYMHNSQLLVNVGTVVTQGQVIAKAGTTGNSTGPHCHFSIKVSGEFVNPLDYVSLP